ncbi:MAG: hypothetical protein VB137_08410 [Burkholderia sp.]
MALGKIKALLDEHFETTLPGASWDRRWDISATSGRSAKASLNLYLLIETCKANNVDVYHRGTDA